jgi:thiamine transport system substrate-binding protein
MANPKNLIRFVPAEGLDADHAPIPVLTTKEARAMRKQAFFLLLLWRHSSVHCQPAIERRQVELTIYTYDSFVAEWGPGPQDRGSL